MGADTSQMKILVTPSYGDSDVYVKVGGGTAHTYSYDYRSTNVGLLADTVTISEADICTDCVVSILVYAYKTSQFSILLTLEDTVVYLTDSIPQRGAVSMGRFQYYAVVAPFNCTSTATLTVFHGEPSLFMSRMVQDPHNLDTRTGTVGDNSMSTGNLPTVSIANVLIGQSVYVGVGGGTGPSNATYTVRVSFDPLPSYHPPGPLPQPPLLHIITGLPQVKSSASNI
jgi:hypothetical protein